MDLLRKSNGTFVTMPDGVGVSQDVLLDVARNGYDVLGSGETSADPQWGGPIEGSPFPLERVYRVTGVPVPQPQPGGGGQPQPLSTFTAAAQQFEVRVRDLAALVDKLNDRVRSLENAPHVSEPQKPFDGTRVAFKADNGHYLTSEPNGFVNTAGPRPFGAYQIFTVEIQG
jgi:hypothetical protein